MSWALFLATMSVNSHVKRYDCVFSSMPARRNGAFISGFLGNFNNVLEFDKSNGPMMRNEDRTYS